MAIYTVHAPVSYGSDVRTTDDKVVFVRDGFHFWALAFGPFWLIWHRLWLVLIGYFVVSGVLGVTLALLGAGGVTALYCACRDANSRDADSKPRLHARRSAPHYPLYPKVGRR